MDESIVILKEIPHWRKEMLQRWVEGVSDAPVCECKHCFLKFVNLEQTRVEMTTWMGKEWKKHNSLSPNWLKLYLQSSFAMGPIWYHQSPVIFPTQIYTVLYTSHGHSFCGLSVTVCLRVCAPPSPFLFGCDIELVDLNPNRYSSVWVIWLQKSPNSMR